MMKYWEFEDAPIKDKIKKPAIKEIAKVFYENETEAYRFSLLLTEVKKRGSLKLKDVPDNIPVSTAKRYLDNAVVFGMLKHEDNRYSVTDRYTRPLRNLAAYIKAWSDAKEEEDLDIVFPSAAKERQRKRGGRGRTPEENGT